MPYARKHRSKRSRPTRRPAGVRKRTYKNRRTIFRPQRLLRVGFPRTTMVKLRYVDGVTLDPGVSTLATHVFRANSCFDPDQTAVGHQPMNFDQWSLLYNHYTVVGSKITIQLFDNNAIHTGGILCGVNLSDDTTFTSDPSTMMEQGLSSYRMVNPVGAAASGRGPSVTKGFSAKRFFNITNPTDNTNRIGANTGSNPTEQAYFVVFLGPCPGSTIDFTAHQLVVKIDYVCIFSEPREQPQS